MQPFHPQRNLWIWFVALCAVAPELAPWGALVPAHLHEGVVHCHVLPREGRLTDVVVARARSREGWSEDGSGQQRGLRAQHQCRVRLGVRDGAQSESRRHRHC
eukprot:6737233-Pyramimonas_sp.AAC.2